MFMVFQVSKSFMVHDMSYFMEGLVFWWSQSGLYATAVGSESVYSWSDPVTCPEH